MSRNYRVIGAETLQPIRSVEQVIKDTAVACRLVSDGASVEECDIYRNVILRCLMHTLVSNSAFVKNQEIILCSGKNQACNYAQYDLTFSRNMWYDYQKRYLECPTEYYEYCPLPCSEYSYDFDIKALTSVVLRCDRPSAAKAVQISESNLIDGQFRNSGKSAYYCLFLNVGYQRLTIPSYANIFPIKLRGLFTFIDKECVLDEHGRPKLAFSINQTTDTLYLQSLSDEEFTSIIMISIPTILTQLGKEESITPLMYDRARIAIGNLKAACKVPVYPFLI